ncbi:MAG: hypothetical protein IH593_11295, partial [Bacteroidales bacterium]|nr:hypothetical protein [Bacteroidales bacterium]
NKLLPSEFKTHELAGHVSEGDECQAEICHILCKAYGELLLITMTDTPFSNMWSILKRQHHDSRERNYTDWI